MSTGPSPSSRRLVFISASSAALEPSHVGRELAHGFVLAVLRLVRGHGGSRRVVPDHQAREAVVGVETL